MSRDAAFRQVVDDRGTLSAVELDLLPIQGRRVFTVTGPPGGAWRGDHRATCDEWLVLVAGVVDLEVGEVRRTLRSAGDAHTIHAGEYVRYHLADEHTCVLVIAAQPYVDRAEPDVEGEG